MKRAASDTSKATDPSWDLTDKTLFDRRASSEQQLAQTRPVQRRRAKATKCNAPHGQSESRSQGFTKPNLSVGNTSQKKMEFSTKVNFPSAHSVCFLLYKTEELSQDKTWTTAKETQDDLTKN